jgi:hypothetical protein
MEMLQGNSLYSYLKQTKCHFFFYKMGPQESRTGPAWEDWYKWEVEEGGKMTQEG